MQIHVCLHGILRDKLPPETKGRAALELPVGMVVSHILNNLNIKGHVQIAINDKIIDDWRLPLHDGDEMDIFRPAAGGQEREDDTREPPETTRHETTRLFDY